MCSQPDLAFCLLSGKIGSHPRPCIDRDLSGTVRCRATTNCQWNSSIRLRGNANYNTILSQICILVFVLFICQADEDSWGMVVSELDVLVRFPVSVSLISEIHYTAFPKSLLLDFERFYFKP